MSSFWKQNERENERRILIFSKGRNGEWHNVFKHFIFMKLYIVTFPFPYYYLLPFCLTFFFKIYFKLEKLGSESNKNALSCGWGHFICLLLLSSSKKKLEFFPKCLSALNIIFIQWAFNKCATLENTSTYFTSSPFTHCLAVLSLFASEQH